jgi:long-chain acyl-CoA synthetase
MAFRTVRTLLDEAAQRFGDRPALFEPDRGRGARTWKSMSWREYRQAVDEIAVGLDSMGIGRGDVVALHSETRLEFYLADLGIQAMGGIAAALYTAYPAADLVKTILGCDAKAVVVENPKMLGALLSAAEPPLAVRWILMTGEAEGAATLEQVRAAGRSAMESRPEALAEVTGRVRPEDHAILYLTSGATGEPKMGLVSHAAIVANLDITPEVTPLNQDDRTIAFLPSAHITQRLAMQMMPLRVGMAVYFSEGLSRLPHELKSVRPTFFVAPPRVWERMYSSICTEIRKRGAITQRIFYSALGLGAEVARRRQDRRDTPAWMAKLLSLADRAVFRQIRERLGGELRMAVSGAAPLGKDLAEFYAAIGMPIYEGYGLTEGGIVALNPFGRPKSGSIGTAFPNVELKLADDGELIIRGPVLFSGYYKAPEATQAVLRDGWLHTGDVAEFDPEGYVYITGRKKEVLVSSNGKKIYPALVEGLFKMDPIVHQVLLLGDKQPYVAALFTLNAGVAETLKGMEPFKGRPMAELVAAPPVQAEFKRIVARVNKQVAPFEQIRKFHVLERDFSIEDGELTPTMKVRRARVVENHRKVVADLFMGREESM